MRGCGAQRRSAQPSVRNACVVMHAAWAGTEPAPPLRGSHVFDKRSARSRVPPQALAAQPSAGGSPALEARRACAGRQLTRFEFAGGAPARSPRAARPAGGWSRRWARCGRTRSTRGWFWRPRAPRATPGWALLPTSGSRLAAAVLCACACWQAPPTERAFSTMGGGCTPQRRMTPACTRRMAMPCPRPHGTLCTYVAVATNMLSATLGSAVMSPGAR